MAERHFMQRRGPNSSLYVRPIDASTRLAIIWIITGEALPGEYNTGMAILIQETQILSISSA